MTTTRRKARNGIFLVLFVILNVVVILIVAANADINHGNNMNDDSTAPTTTSDASVGGTIEHQKQLDQTIQDVLQSSEQTLQEYEQYIATTPIETTHPSMTERINHLQSLFDQVEQLEMARDQLVHQINTQQMMELLQTLEHVEGSTTVSNGPTETVTTAVTISEMERRLTSQQVLAESEAILSDWIRSIIRQEINQLDVTSFLSLSSSSSSSSSSRAKGSSSSCISIETAAEEVYYGLMQYIHDGIGLMDFTRSIVHQYTSPTFVVDDDDRSSTLSTVWWNRYIPQDWEYLLPEGWQSWKVWSFNIPDHIYHSVGWLASSRNQRNAGGARCAPPEAVLQSSTFPGHCWPVAMTYKPAVVTIRLHTSIIVSAISIDHTSKMLLAQRQELNSAPKRMKVYGYAPCPTTGSNSSDDHICRGLGFDIMSKALIAEFTYNIDDENNVQTFLVDNNLVAGSTAGMASPGESSCSETATTQSCSGQSSPVVSAAVTLEILDNWGNDEYTCLYRVRVHGEPIH